MTIPAAVDTISAGTCATSPSPTVNKRVGLRRGGHGHALLQHTDGQAAENIHQGDDDRGDGIAAHEFTGTVHGPIEIRFLRHFLPALRGLLCR